LQKFSFPDPVDPLGKASACLREAASAKSGAELFDEGEQATSGKQGEDGNSDSQ
jgi:hypothetical protein